MAQPLRVTMSGPTRPVLSCLVGLMVEWYTYMRELCSRSKAGPASRGTCKGCAQRGEVNNKLGPGVRMGCLITILVLLAVWFKI